jgi:hypothetical protein
VSAEPALGTRRRSLRRTKFRRDSDVSGHPCERDCSVRLALQGFHAITACGLRPDTNYPCNARQIVASPHPYSNANFAMISTAA